MKLDEVAERFALDTVFSEYPSGATIGDLAEVAEGDIFDAEGWWLCEEYEQLAYVSASAILDAVEDNADSFRRYFDMVTEVNDD
jgi:hypothetical protein